MKNNVELTVVNSQKYNFKRDQTKIPRELVNKRNPSWSRNCGADDIRDLFVNDIPFYFSNETE